MKFHKKLFAVTLMAFSGMLCAESGQYDNAGWYVSLDLEQAREKLIPHMSINSKTENNVSFEDVIPGNFDHLTAYGQTNDSTSLTLLISGDLSDFTVMSFVSTLEQQAGEDVNFSQTNSSVHNGHEVKQFTLNGDSKSKSFYTSKINDDLLVVSLLKDEVVNWAEDKYSTANMHQNGLVSVRVNIESAVVHMGADIEQGSHPFQSQIFQKIQQFSASLAEAKDQLMIETALVTTDDQTAQQVQSVLKGLVAMNALSNVSSESPALASLLENLSISAEDNLVMMMSQLPLSQLSEIDFD